MPFVIVDKTATKLNRRTYQAESTKNCSTFTPYSWANIQTYKIKVNGRCAEIKTITNKCTPHAMTKHISPPSHACVSVASTYTYIHINIQDLQTHKIKANAALIPEKLNTKSNCTPHAMAKKAALSRTYLPALLPTHVHTFTYTHTYSCIYLNMISYTYIIYVTVMLNYLGKYCSHK